MNKKVVWKIRLRPDGTWENVYEDDSVKINRLKEYNLLLQFKDELIDLAMEARGFDEANEVINRIKNDGPRNPESV
jgi:hypothetical protein